MKVIIVGQKQVLCNASENIPSVFWRNGCHFFRFSRSWSSITSNILKPFLLKILWSYHIGLVSKCLLIRVYILSKNLVKGGEMYTTCKDDIDFLQSRIRPSRSGNILYPTPILNTSSSPRNRITIQLRFSIS
jgi:hypothetical protein